MVIRALERNKAKRSEAPGVRVVIFEWVVRAETYRVCGSCCVAGQRLCKGPVAGAGMACWSHRRLVWLEWRIVMGMDMRSESVEGPSGSLWASVRTAACSLMETGAIGGF